MEDLYRRLLEFSQAGIYQYSFETGKIIFANQGLVDILGLNCAPEDLEGDYLKNLLIYVEEEASIRSLLDKHGEIHDHEYNFKTLNGEDRWVIHNSILTLDPDTGEKTVEAIVKDITERKKIEKKLKHIDTVLRAVNNITQFIVREKDRKRLLEQICKYLIEIPNYTHSWIAIKGSSGELEAWAEAGIGKSFKALSRKLKKGDQPSCVTEAMKQSTSIHVNHPSESCSGCPLADTFSEHSVIVSRLEHSDRIFGTLAVSISQTFISNHEDIELLEEIARDIGLALHDIELEYERAQAEEEIRKERDKAQKYLDVAGVIILALDTDQNVTLINNKGCEILECPEDEIIGKNWFNNFIPKRLQKEVKHVFTRLMSGDIEPTEYFENLILTETGEERTIAWHNTMLTDKNGTITGALASGTDITQRKVAEKALRESETRLQQVTDHARAWVWEVDTVGVYTYASPAVKTILGFDPEELIGKKHFFDLFSPDTREELTRKTFEVFQKKETFREFSNLNIHKKGHEVWLSTNGFPLLDNDGELIGYRGSDTDVTEKRKTGKALKESERRYRRITEAVTDYIFTVFVVAGHPVKTVHGEACVAVTGYTTEEFENNPFLWIAMVPEEDRPKVKKQAASVMKGVEPKPLEHRIIRKDGQIRWVRNKLVPHYDIRGNLLSYDGLIRDVSERKRTEEALIESEEQYRCLFEYSLEGICLSKGNRILSANKALLDIFGYDSPDTFMDIPLIEHIAPEAKKLFIQLVKKREPGKKLSDKFETKILRKESEIRDVAIATTEVVIDNELCILGTFRDITVRKIAERALQESEKKYRAIFEQAADSIVLVDSETGELAAFNKRAHKALGYTRREFKKLTLRDIEFIESPGEIKQHLKYVVEKKADLFETMHRTKKGYIRDILVNARSLSIEGRNYIQAIWIDITDRKKAEKQLRESQERYRRLFEYSPISLWEEDFSLYKAWIDKMKDSGITNFRNYFKKHPEAIEQCSRLVQIVDVNQATLDLYQAKNKEEVTSNLAGIFTEESYNVFTEELMALAEGDLEFSSEAVTRTLEGEEKYIALEWNVIPGHEETWAKVLVSIIDLTDRRKMEEDLFKARKMESIGFFARGVAKDFDSIINNVIRGIDLAKIESKPGEKLHEILTSAEKSALRAKDLTHQLLLFARGGVAFATRISIDDLLKNAVNYALANSDVKCTITVPDNIWPVELDEAQMLQVIINLITNAEQSLSTGGTISIEAENLHVAKKHLLPLNKGKYLKITIMDHGKGLEAEQVTRIFDPYYSPKKGHALGLATSYSIIKKHDGYMRVESELGVGTTFHIYLPASLKK